MALGGPQNPELIDIASKFNLRCGGCKPGRCVLPYHCSHVYAYVTRK